MPSSDPPSRWEGSSRWEASWSAMHKRMFFFNRSLGTSQWAKPEEVPDDVVSYADPELQEKIANVQKETGRLPKDWTAAWDEHYDRVYYYRPSNGQRSWHKPFIPEKTEEEKKKGDSKDDEACVGQTLALQPAPMGTSASSTGGSQMKLPSSRARSTAERDPILNRIPWDFFTFAYRMKDAREAPNSQKFVQELFVELYRNNLKVVASPWTTPAQYKDWKEKLEKLADDNGDTDDEWNFRIQKATSRYGLRVPQSLFVEYTECYNALTSRQVIDSGDEPKVVFWKLSKDVDTGEATVGVMKEGSFQGYVDVVRYLVKRQSFRSEEVVAISMADGRAPAGYVGDERIGDYVDGNDGWEAELCRRIPALWPSLVRGLNFNLDSDPNRDKPPDSSDASTRKRREWPLPYSPKGHPFFPFGPTTCDGEKRPFRYRDGIYTPGVEIARGGETSGYALLDFTKRASVNIMSMAPPVVNQDFDAAPLVRGSLLTMFIGPKMMNPNNTVLVLPIWGCGPPWNNKARDMANIFAQAIKGEVTLSRSQQSDGTAEPAKIRMGRFYKEIHFVFDRRPSGEGNSMDAGGLVSRGGNTRDEPADIDVFKRKFRDKKYNIPYVLAEDDLEPIDR